MIEVIIGVVVLVAVVFAIKAVKSKPENLTIFDRNDIEQ